MSVSVANTPRVLRSSTGIEHKQGGWEPSVDVCDAKQMERFRKRVSKSTEFRKALGGCVDVANMCVRQNNTVDIFEEYWESDDAAEQDQFESSRPGTHVQAILRFVHRG